jgi:protocatechuate 3,4-dioxygenase beta subunit
MAQQEEGQNGWIWSVKTGDIQGLNKNYIPSFYMPNDVVNISWNIKPANSPNTDIKNVQLSIYPTGKDTSVVYGPKEITPVRGQNYNGDIYNSYQYVPLSNVSVSPDKTYNVEIMANAITESKKINETHIIEIKIKIPGTLVLRKTVPGWEKADLSGWKFSIKGPIEFPQSNQIDNTSTTDITGIATFTGLRPGNYTLTEESKDGWRRIDPMKVDVQPGSNPQQIFENKPNSIAINKFDSEGHPLSNWVFKLIGQGGQGTFTTTPTDSSGVTVIKGLPSGTYNIQENPKDEWRQISIDSNPIAFGSGEDKYVRVVNANTATLQITKMDSEGQPLPGWNFGISGPDQVATNLTDNSGSVIVKGLLPGNYTVTENLKAGWTPVTPASRTITLAPGEHRVLEPFINAAVIGLTIIKFNDANKNGIYDKNESGLSGWTFTVEGPNGFSAKTDPTNTDGITILKGLVPGSYVVKEDISQNIHPGWIGTTSNSQTVVVSRRTSPPVVEFGNKVNRLLINVFNDTNQNRVRDREKGLPGWISAIEGANGFTETVGPTNSDGIIAVEGLVPGKYNIRENLKNGWINTTPTNQLVSIGAGEDKEVVFGNINTSYIEIFKFNDTNRNGKLDLGESGVSGLVFTISGPHGFIKTTEPTDANGISIVKGLYPGNYTVTESQRDRWISTTPISQYVSLHFGDYQRVSFGNYYCQACYRIHDTPKLNSRYNQDISVIKNVSSISTGDMNATTGSVVTYNIQLCPSGGLENIGSTPTDIVIAVDNSPSINSLNNSAISAAQELVKGIEEKDKLNVTRVGLVSWSDINNSKIEIALTNKYDTILSAAPNIKFAEGKETDFQEGLDLAQKAFQEVSKSAGTGRTKKVVFITDANDEGYHGPTRYPSSDYTIYAIVVGDKKETNTSYQVLSNLTKNYHGYLASIKNPLDLERVLTQMATAGPMLKNVRLVETLPNYLILKNDTVTDNGKLRLNGDSKDWTTTTIEWDVGDLVGCWSTDFQAVFCWKLPADVNQPKLASYVNYTDDKGVSRSITLPEYEINIVHSVEQAPQNAPAEGATVKQPGFEWWGAIVGLIAMMYLFRRHNEET